ncbi:MAG TPA: 3-dehydroquinate synthase [Polyangiaceae bacterium]|nr:3-dehydroquinate synthase [Polyangiaceae bacterium]
MQLARPIFLNGMMGTGKSTLGRALAERVRVPFVDLDAEVERRAGVPIREIFAKQGEAAFRTLEREVLLNQLDILAPRVVALGGGSLLGRGVRLRALQCGFVVTLAASAAVLIERMSGDESRPLLLGSPSSAESRIQELIDARASAYAEAHLVVETGGRAIDDLTTEVLRLVAHDPIPVPLADRTYVVDVVGGAGDEHLAAALKRLAPSRVVVVTDENVDPLVVRRLTALTRYESIVKIVLPAGERHKTLASVETILRAAIDAPVDRQAVVVGVGGGVITDIAGLAAALALRGLRWIAVPTTTLAMVDASVGGKTAVDLGAAKNAVGAFHQPSRVIVDPSLTRTESIRAVRSGLAEVIKTALIGDAALYAELSAPGGAERLGHERDPVALARAIRSSIAVKAGVVGRDERESGERAHLNLGHTVGHALEAEGGFERLTHGEAVALGLVAALRVGVALGVTGPTLAADVVRLLGRLGLPCDLDAEPLESSLRWVAYDKKRAGGALRFVLIRAPGAVEVIKIAPSELPKLLGKT